MSSERNEATIRRVFDAPRGRVWQAITEPAELSAWFFTPPYTLPVETVTMDVRPGGAFRATMVHESDGSELPFVGTYREVEAPNRLVQTLENPGDPDDPNTETLTYMLEDADGGTALVYHQTGHLPAEQYPLIEQGVAGFYERLAEHLARS
jgi:uncharacterized protein YndB with AHSA1/START domain